MRSTEEGGSLMNIFLQKQKEKVFKDCLILGKTLVLFITVDPNIKVPEFVKTNLRNPPHPIAGVHFSRAFANILSWDKEAISQTLTFDTLVFPVVIPWEAIIYINSKDDSIKQGWSYKTPEEPEDD
jgi:hypothetical protein